MATVACRAETEGRGRCRNDRLEADKDGFCSLHAGLRDSGKTVEFAAKPDRVLLRANVNPRWAERFYNLGIPLVEPDFEAQEQKHAAQAEELGRKADGLCENRKAGGVPVFGALEGAHDIIVASALLEVMCIYRLTDMHMFQRRDRATMYVLVLTFEKGLDGDRVELPRGIAEFFAITSWKFCHVWANPPEEDKGGAVIHTVNCTCREEAVKATKVLVFANGLWQDNPREKAQ